MKISVIIPTYNSEKTISGAVGSVLGQTYQDFELIIVDDGSKDNTREIIEELAKKDNRIKYFYQDNSGGPASPLNRGIREAKGDYIAFLEQDDEWLPDKLKKQISLIEKENSVGIVSCGAIIKNDITGRERVFVFKKNRTSEEWFRAMLENDFFFYNLSTLLIKRSVYKEVFFDENLKIAADMDLYIRLMPAGFCVVKEPLVIYHSNPNSLSKDKKSSIKIVNDFEYILDKHKDLYQKFSKARSLTLGYLGTLLYCAGDRENARKYFKESLTGYKMNIKLYFKIILLLVAGPKLYFTIRNAYFSYIRIK